MAQPLTNSPTSTPFVITLGTAGGPRWWMRDGRLQAGISTAVVVAGRVYLVDCGYGAAGQLARAGYSVRDLAGIFITHLHSDHIVDLAAFVPFGFMSLGTPGRPVPVVGPGDRGALPPVSPHAERDPEVLFPDAPTPGTAATLERTLRAYSTDLSDRMLDALRPSPREFFTGVDIAIPDGLDYDPNLNPSPVGMEPVEVYRDELVVVTATLVQHPPVAPAFAYRFDTEEGSVTISGDTAPSDNLVRLARSTDLLLHEAIDLDAVRQQYDGVPEQVVEATMEHHVKSHTTAEQAGEIATRAGARALALHHLVPATVSPEVWLEAKKTYDGPLLVPNDLDRIDIGSLTRTGEE